jgi:hypothetical protein
LEPGTGDTIKENVMIKHLLYGSLLFCLFSSLCYGYDDTPDCFKKLEKNFFVSSFTQQSFSLHNVPQSSWTLIYNQLLKAADSIPRTVRDRAQNLRVNPLENPFNPDKAWEILEQALFDVFLQVLRANNVFHQYNDNDIRDMFEYIKFQQVPEINACFQQKKSFN